MADVDATCTRPTWRNLSVAAVDVSRWADLIDVVLCAVAPPGVSGEDGEWDPKTLEGFFFWGGGVVARISSRGRPTADVP